LHCVRTFLTHSGSNGYNDAEISVIPALHAAVLVTCNAGDERARAAAKEALDEVGTVSVIAPDSNRSAVGRGITIDRALTVTEVELRDGTRGFATDGTPVDCVRFAELGLVGERPELIVSGINHGANLGDDITYSGTVSAAMEAVINGCPAFAISQEYYEHPDFTLASLAAATVARNILEHGLSRGELINVNVPAVSPDEAKGFEVTRLGRRVYQDQLIERVDPRGIPYFWIGGPPPSGLAVPGTDFHAVINRRIAVTPIHLDLTGRRLLRRLKTWNWSLEPTAGQISQEAAKPPGPDRPEALAVDEELSEERRRDRR
jgi:5'-nucleotidase